MLDKRIHKLLNKAIKRQELEGLLSSLGFELAGGKGSHRKWVKKGVEPIVIATHTKELKRYTMDETIAVLKKAGMIRT